MILRYWEIARILVKEIIPETASNAHLDQNPQKPSEAFLLAIQQKYVRETEGILDATEMKIALKELDSALEPLGVFDRDDHPIIWLDGLPLIDFRKDIESKEDKEPLPEEKEPLPEEKEHELYCRVVLVVLEDANGNVIVSRRSLNKSHGGLLEMSGGHVLAGENYLECAYREVLEEINFTIPKWSLSEVDGILKWRNLRPGKDGYKGNGSIVTIYQVKVPDVTALTPNPKEISEFIVFTPEELATAISHGRLGDKTNEFAAHHAYWYLEYLENKRGINTSDVRELIIKNGHMKNREKMG